MSCFTHEDDGLYTDSSEEEKSHILHVHDPINTILCRSLLITMRQVVKSRRLDSFLSSSQELQSLSHRREVRNTVWRSQSTQDSQVLLYLRHRLSTVDDVLILCSLTCILWSFIFSASLSRQRKRQMNDHKEDRSGIPELMAQDVHEM
jgi:hypothetical protein